MKEKEFLPLLSRLGIETPNPMQQRMLQWASEGGDAILLSPTGSGKTLAFVLPLLKILKPSSGRVQAVIIAPSRELVLQIYGVIRELAVGIKTTPVYGGHNVEDEVNSLSANPDIIVGTPGRLLDHVRRRNIDLLPTRILVLDEFDKSLELGFEDEMRRIFAHMKNVSRIILTSATDMISLPDFISLNKPSRFDYLNKNSQVRNRMRIHRVDADSRDKLESLLQLLSCIALDNPPLRAIVFVNHRESAERVASFLQSRGVPVALYHGKLDQIDREKAISAFNNGSRSVLVATDLAARGLDIDSVRQIIHYHQSLTPETYTHRNGRTARVEADGDIYILFSPDEDTKDWVNVDDTYHLNTEAPVPALPEWETLYIHDGKKEKLSRGDIAGFIIKTCGFPADDVGKIDIFDHYALVAVKRDAAKRITEIANKEKIKGKRRRVSYVNI